MIGTGALKLARKQILKIIESINHADGECFPQSSFMYFFFLPGNKTDGNAFLSENVQKKKKKKNITSCQSNRALQCLQMKQLDNNDVGSNGTTLNSNIFMG